MTREQLEHVLRAAAAITRENSFVTIGSQAVLLPYPDAPAELRASREIDLYPALRPDKADLIDGAIDPLSSFDETFGYHAAGVAPETAAMPADWMDRAALYYIGDVTAICPEIHDLALSKCVAGRDKDADFVGGLLRHSMVHGATLLTRCDSLDRSRCEPAAVRAWIGRCIGEVESTEGRP